MLPQGSRYLNVKNQFIDFGNYSINIAPNCSGYEDVKK